MNSAKPQDTRSILKNILYYYILKANTHLELHLKNIIYKSMKNYQNIGKKSNKRNARVPHWNYKNHEWGKYLKTVWINRKVNCVNEIQV